MLILLASAACNGPGTKILDDTGRTGPEDSGVTEDDTGGQEGDVQGPDLPECTPQSGDGTLVALSGVVLAPEGPIAGTVVYSPSEGTIGCVGSDCDTTGADIVCTEGIISPGLIDAHNHLQYNILPPWEVEPEFEDRYEWQADDRYDLYKDAYNEVSSAWGCEIMKWAEARELVHGTTAAVGSYGNDCINVLIRNLDEGEDASLLDDYELVYGSSNVTSSIEDEDAEDYLADLASGSTDAVLQHVAEGWNGSVRDEIDHMAELGMVGPGQAFVHSADASLEQLAVMAADGTGIVWSPRSNLALYGTTTPIHLAEALGVPWAIGTDWTPSGSMAPTRELACAADWLEGKGSPLSDRDLWEKSTSDAARIVGLDGVLGELVAGYRADIAVFAWDRAPYRAIIESDPQEVRLVVVDGAAIYGATDLVSTLAEEPGWCDALDVCGEARSLCAKAGSSGDDAQTLADVESELLAALAGTNPPEGYEYTAELYPLFTCEEELASCDLRQPGADDGDGDGVDDGSDVCVGIYDPLQWDGDGDGVGDDCDDCPLAADTSDCPTTAADVDGDGVTNDEDNCETTSNADQADADADGTGDACDACPEDPSTDGCASTILDIRDPSRPDHPAEGTRVRISGVVVTAVRVGGGFFVQDTSALEYGGLYVYDQGANTVAVGDVVDVSGTYEEYYEMTELTSPTAVVTGTASVPSPLEADPCDLGTGGSLAEPYESMLVVVRDVSVTDVDPDAPEDYDEFVVGGCLRVDDFVWDELDQPAEGTAYASITGVLPYSFDNAKIAPRDAGDLEEE